VWDEEKNKALTRWWWEEVWVKGNVSAMDEFIAPNYVDHPNLPGLPPGPEGMKQALTYYRAASPQLQATLDDILAEGERVALRWSARGTHLGEWLDVPPDWTPLYDERDHHLPARRGQGGGRLEQHRGEPHGGREAVVDRRRWMAKEERRDPRHRARSVSLVLGGPYPQPHLVLPG
jgi:predicted SnoaL-like aldol condensation-catalyzing enzyme